MTLANQKKTGMTQDYFEAIGNIFIFLPYFFSAPTIFRTLFEPWKNITVKKTIRGFTFSDFFNRLGFNIISRLIGVTMRTCLLIFYAIVQTIYVLLIPPITIIFFIALPLLKWMRSQEKSAEEEYAQYRLAFIKHHILDEKNTELVGTWFDTTIGASLHTRAWWKLDQLFQTPPLARDWAVGYTPTLDEYAEELTQTDYQLSIRHHIIGRSTEVKLIERTLSQSEEANGIIVGANGVGKHTILHAFSRAVYEGKITPLLAYKRILRLRLERVLTEFTEQNQREAFLENLLQEAAESHNVILVIEDIDRYVISAQDRVDLSIPIEKYAKGSAIQFLAITTPFAYETYVFPNQKIRQLFTKIDIDEIDAETALRILLERILEFEKRYHIKIPYETAQNVINKSSFYITTIPFPEKALQLLDAACVYAVQTAKKTILLPEMIDIVLSQRTHIPTSLTDSLKEKLLTIEQSLKNTLQGQDEALAEVSSTLRRSFLLLGKRKKPLATFLLLGPTGVGKTETAKKIASSFFGSENEMIRFDMSLFQSRDDIGKLVGSIQTLNPGLLTSAIRENPYGVLLIDEIEKAHPDLLNIFLTILDEGYFTDGYGQRVDCKNLVIIATSNAGAEHLFKLIEQSQQSGLDTNQLVSYLIGQHLFSPEFLNRFDGVIAYKPISTATAQQIAVQIVNNIIKTIKDQYQVSVTISPQLLQQLTAQGYNTQYGVRDLERILRKHIEDRVAKDILSGKAKAGDRIDIQ